MTITGSTVNAYGGVSNGVWPDYIGHAAWVKNTECEVIIKEGKSSTIYCYSGATDTGVDKTVKYDANGNITN